MENDKHSIIPGTTVSDKYRIEKIIGAGGMGAVYEATHNVIGRKVAIKTLHASFVKNEGVLQRFQREAQLAGSIGHDNICEVTDFGTTKGGSPYLVMPLLKGQALADMLEEHKILPPDRLLDIVSQTLSALEAAHQAQIVHRDLKPENIFITRIGDRSDFVKLLDFGISKVLDQDEVLSLTRTGTVLGTPYYMSPEQAKGAKDVDHRSDIYATGVILYEALTGSRPFEGDSYNEVMFKIVAEPFPTPSELNPSITKDFEQVVIKAMSRDPNERYGNAAEMRDALDSLSSQDAQVRPMQTARTEVLDTNPDLATLGRLKETSTPLATELKTREELPAASRSRSVIPLLAGVIVALCAVALVTGWYVFFDKGDPTEKGTEIPIEIPVDEISAEDKGETENIEETVKEEPEPEEEEVDTAEDTAVAQEDVEPGIEEEVVAAEEARAKEETASDKKKRRRRRKDKEKEQKVVITPTSPTSVDLPKESASGKPSDKNKEVEGRFGTKIVSDYDD